MHVHLPLSDRDWLTVPPYIFFLSYKNGIFRREQSPRYCLSNASVQLYKALWLSSSCQNVCRNGVHPLKGGATPCFLRPAASVQTRWWGTQVHAEKCGFLGTAQHWERSPNWNTLGSLWETQMHLMLKTLLFWLFTSAVRCVFQEDLNVEGISNVSFRSLFSAVGPVPESIAGEAEGSELRQLSSPWSAQ